MDGYRTDEEQVEQLKKWWNENGKSIIGGIAIGLIAIFGWRGWQDHQVTQGEQASNLYEQMVANISQKKEIVTNKDIGAIADQLHQDFK